MGTTPRRDPLAEERERAQQGSEDRTPPAESGDVPSHPSLGAPPRRDKSRPVFRDSQLGEGEDDPERKLRG